MLELPAEERARIRRNSERWDAMNEGERERLREQMRRLRALSVDERIELLERALGEAPATSAPRREE